MFKVELTAEEIEAILKMIEIVPVVGEQSMVTVLNLKHKLVEMLPEERLEEPGA